MYKINKSKDFLQSFFSDSVSALLVSRKAWMITAAQLALENTKASTANGRNSHDTFRAMMHRDRSFRLSLELGRQV